MNNIALRRTVKLNCNFPYTRILFSILKIKLKGQHIYSFWGISPTGYWYALVMKTWYQQINHPAVNNIFGYYLSLYLCNVNTIQTVFS